MLALGGDIDDIGERCSILSMTVYNLVLSLLRVSCISIPVLPAYHMVSCGGAPARTEACKPCNVGRLIANCCPHLVRYRFELTIEELV